MGYKMKAFFHPAPEVKNGHIGWADVTIAEAFEVPDISVFLKKDGSGINIQFPGFGEGEQFHSYIVPKSAEAHAEFVSVIEMAVKDTEKHFGYATGKQDPYLKITGKKVNEPYADARFSVEIGDLCTLHGITTRSVKNKDKEGSRVYVDLPKAKPYEKDGEMVYPTVYRALEDGVVYNKETKQEEKKDFHVFVNNLIKAERKKVLNLRPSLDEQVNGAEQKAAQNKAGKEGPAPEKAR